MKKLHQVLVFVWRIYIYQYINFLLDLSFKNNVAPQWIQDLTIDGAVKPIFYQNCNTTWVTATVAGYHICAPFIFPLVLCCYGGMRFFQKKTKSALRFRHQTKMVLLFRKSLKPFTFSETNLKIIDQSNLLCGNGIAEIRNNTCRREQECKWTHNWVSVA